MPSTKVRLIAAVRQNIGGRWVLAGEEFDATKQEADDLVAARFATLAPPRPPEPPTYKRRDMRAEN